MPAHLDVGHPVVVEVAGGCEPLSAGAALVRLLPAVDPPVGVEGGRGGEALVADVADVRPLPGVGARVAVEQAGAVKALAAEAAREHLFALLVVRGGGLWRGLRDGDGDWSRSGPAAAPIAAAALPIIVVVDGGCHAVASRAGRSVRRGHGGGRGQHRWRRKRLLLLLLSLVIEAIFPA